MASLTSVGISAERVEGKAKVTGEALYAADVIIPGMLWGKCLRSPFPHARIRSIDTTQARALPGVHAVITAQDIDGALIGRYLMDMPILADGVVRFIGEKVAAVAAESPEIAEKALSLIEVDYEELAAVFDAVEAMQPDAPVVHDDSSAYAVAPSPVAVHGELKLGTAGSNVMASVVYRHGDLDGAFERADHVFEHTFKAAPIHQGYMEPHACLVSVEPDGKIDFWYSHKQPFLARMQMAQALGIPEERIRINPTFIGGDFGGKGTLMDGLVCYYLAAHSGRPVKMIMTYTEELMAGNPRHDALMTLRTAVTKNGEILARHGTMTFNTGAYASFTPAPILHGAFDIGGSYRVGAMGLDVVRVYTNTVPRGHMRAPGTPQVLFAVECHTDMIAHELGIDPVEFRLRNAVVEGDLGPLGEEWAGVRCKETLEAAAEAIDWATERPPNVGRGIALYGREPGSFGPSSATLELHEDGRLLLITGAAETGTGFFTILQQIVAEELNVPLESVFVAQNDTDHSTFELGASGSRLTHTAGQAAVIAAQEMKAFLDELAGPGRTALGMLELATLAAAREEMPVRRGGRYMPQGPAGSTSFHAQAAEVEVDPETGAITLRHFVTAHDVGTIINPITHQGQVDGGIAFGIGQALCEQLPMEDGQVMTLHLGDYKLPTAADMPRLTTVLLQSDVGPAPFNGKAIGEMTNVAVPAAIGNAIFDAIGIRITELPITAEKVHRALAEARRDGSSA